MKVDNNTLRQLSLGQDGVRNSMKAQQAEPDAFGQLFASMAQRSQATRSAQGGTAESAPTAHASKEATRTSEDKAKVETEQSRGAKQAGGDAAKKKHADHADAAAQSEAGVAGVKSQPHEVKAKSEQASGGDAAGASKQDAKTGGKAEKARQVAAVVVGVVGEQGKVKLQQAVVGEQGGEIGRAHV